MNATSQSNAQRLHARLIVALFVLATIFFVAIALSPLKSGFADAPSRGPGDVALYRAEVERIRDGQAYYDAAAAELRERGYPTRSVFNWRTPLPVWLIAVLPEITMAKVLLALCGLVLITFSFDLLANDGGVRQGLLGVLLLSGALLPCLLDDLFVMSELWAGVFIAFSAVCFGIGRRQAGIVAAVAALFLRELAAPYCVLCVAFAFGQGHYRELAYWVVGLAAYAVFFALHAAQVLPRIAADDAAHANGWIRFGGAGFLISTVQLNGYLLLLPQWIAAVYLACTLLGAATWNTPAGRLIGLTVAIYAIGFSIAGHDFNQYWGSLTAPLFCLPASRAPFVLGRLALTAGTFSVRSRRRLAATD